MLRILGQPTSINVRKVLWVCAELSLDHELEHWETESGDLRDAVVKESIRDWNRNMSLLDQQLLECSGDFVVGNDFTLADIVIGLSTHRWLSTPIERPTLPAVQSYYERLSQRQGFMQHGRNGVP